MQDHWTKYGPPVYIAVAGYLGLVKPEQKKAEPPVDASSDANFQALEALERQLSGTGGVT